MLYAGTTSIVKQYSFKYSIYNDIVKKLKQWSQSAGNISFYKSNGTPETLRDETVNRENVKIISVHVPNHVKPVNNEQFGHYLAGLIDGGGHFSSKQELVIAFHSLDASLAYFIKTRLGFGSVKKIKGKNASILIVSARKGIEKVLYIINGKIRSFNTFSEINNNILNHESYLEFGYNLNFKLNKDKDLKNHWLAGFSDASASFQIKVLINREIRLNFQIDKKKNDLLLLIKDSLGGNIEYIKNQDTYYYESTSFGSAKNVIKYFDKFQLLSSKHINYLKWRKAYLIIQEKNHLCNEGYEKIIKLKNTMNRLSVDTV